MLFVFPGQGSQFVGMGKEFFENFVVVKEVFEEVDEALHYKLSDIIMHGPLDTLTLTKHAQPAILTVSIAILRTFLHHINKPFAEVARYAAGHSVGEYTALCAAGSISLQDAVRVVSFRGQAMSRAYAVGKGGMVACLGFDWRNLNLLIERANELGYCQLANDNTSEQCVISGEMAAIDFILANYKNFNIKKAIKLNVSGPFHSILIAAASDELADFLQNIEVHNAEVPVISNVTAQPVSTPMLIKDLLVAQVTSQVKWRESVLWAIDHGIRGTIEAGAGNVLTKMMSKIANKVVAVAIQEPADLDKVAQCLLQWETCC